MCFHESVLCSEERFAVAPFRVESVNSLCAYISIKVSRMIVYHYAISELCKGLYHRNGV